MAGVGLLTPIAKVAATFHSEELLSAFLELKKKTVMRGRRYLGGDKVFTY
jgi:hypothetical protein